MSDQDSPEGNASELRPQLTWSESETSFNEALPTTPNREAFSDHEDAKDTPKVTKKRIIKFSDSDSELEDTKTQDNDEGKTVSHVGIPQPSSSDGSSDEDISHKVPKKSRIRKFDSSDSSHSESDIPSAFTNVLNPNKQEAVKDNRENEMMVKNPGQGILNSSSDSSETDTKTPSKYEEQKLRMKEKRNKMKQKFKSLVTSRVKETESTVENVLKMDSSSERDDQDNSDNSDDEASSIDRIKQKIKERTIHLKSTIYDPDTSDEESTAPKLVTKQKKTQKSTKSTSPKPMRMSAKQAMENMQKIKSESNRMLREKEVSLPYHRPKALSLKDIMSRRRPALSADGKALPIKMNEEQLKQYALSLEVRQKEMMELCKSDTEDEQDETTENNDNNLAEQVNAASQIESTTNMSSQNDTLYDSVTQENSESILNTSNNNVSYYSALDGSSNGINNHTTLDVDMSDVAAPKDVEETVEIINKEEIEKESLDNEEVDTIVIESTITNTSNTEVIVKEGTETEMHLVYNDSIEEKDMSINKTDDMKDNNDKQLNSETNPKVGTEGDSQLISLHYDTERTENNTETYGKDEIETVAQTVQQDVKDAEEENGDEQTEAMDNGFSDDDINMDDIDEMIENAEIISQNNTENYDSPMLIRDPRPKSKPKLTGAPGMIIDLDGTDPAHRKLSGVELLKERFTYFAKLKTSEEMEREREKKLKPGTQHLNLKKELENEIAEQRSLEWAKRLEQEKQLHQELNPEDKDSDALDDIDKIEAKLEEKEGSEESNGESEPEENDCDITDKPVARNPMIADEAEESDCDDAEPSNKDDVEDGDNSNDNEDNDAENIDGDDEESDEESSEEESEEEEPTKLKKGRILKAFEDSDEDTEKPEDMDKESIPIDDKTHSENVENSLVKDNTLKANDLLNPALKYTQDDDLQLAQELKSQSEDLFASQESSLGGKETPVSKSSTTIQSDDKDLGTQTFSIIESVAKGDFRVPNDLAGVCDTQSFSQEGNLDAVVGMCSGSFSQGFTVTASQPSQLPESQMIGDDILALCTGKFYDNPFVSQTQNGDLKESSDPENNKVDKCEDILLSNGDDKMETDDSLKNKSAVNDKTETQNEPQDAESLTHIVDTRPISDSIENNNDGTIEDNTKDDILESILDELNEPEAKKPNKYFIGNTQNKENKQDDANIHHKKKLVIDSDDDEENPEETNKKTKRTKKKKLEKRALQISDDESEQSEEEEEYASDIEGDDEERIVEYDSEENEVELPKPVKSTKKQRAPDFFEQEAELTSEDEWMGSGDEDEAGLDRMEREAGDDDTFNQTRLQRELGQIHMRDVLDQDKREVRIIQELLFEDGDLGTGSRQRKFRWRNTDGVEETGVVVDALPDTQEEEFESEELWRKQRHEREMFLRDMQKQDETDEILNISVDRTSIIKANLTSKSMSTVIEEVNVSTAQAPAVEKNTAKDIPSPKKSGFTLFKQNYHGSLLTRGQGALARLAALATPLAADEDAPRPAPLPPARGRNFVFATLTQEDSEPKVVKRKADPNIGTPKLVKKLRTEDKTKKSKSSLIDHYDSFS